MVPKNGTYLQNRNRLTDRKKLMVAKGEMGQGGIN